MGHLPKGTAATPDFARAIASDATRLRAAATYWREALKGLGETVMETGVFSSEAMAFADALPNAPFESLLPEFRGQLDSADEHEMTTWSGCLLSLAEIGGFVYERQRKDLADELKFLGGLAGASAAPQGKDLGRAAGALQLAREIYDLVRRFVIATENAGIAATPRSDLLALHRQEGTLGIAPPRESWPHAPLIATRREGCRSDTIELWDSEDRGGTTTRTSFVLCHRAEANGSPSLKTPVSGGFGAMIRHLLVIGGLDVILNPRLLMADELLIWYFELRRAPRGSYPALDELGTRVMPLLNGSPQGASQRDFLETMLIGLLLLHIETASAESPFPGNGRLVHAAAGEMRRLLDAHPVVIEPTGHIVLAPAADFQDARTTLSAMARWYASRVRIATLLAIRDRAGWTGPSQWAPMLAYVRFHLGDVSFLRALARFAAQLQSLRRRDVQVGLRIPPPIAAMLAKAQWAQADHRRAEALYDRIRALAGRYFFDRVWRKQTYGWQNLGFLEVLKERGSSAVQPPVAPGFMVSMADSARDLLTTYADKELFETLAEFVKGTSARCQGELNLFGLGFDDSLTIARNAFSFERIRRVYAEALAAAGLDENPQPHPVLPPEPSPIPFPL
jgi:hypothetical protein